MNARAQLDCQPLLRELQKAPAVGRCIILAAEFREHDALDIADALAGLLILTARAAALVDQPQVSP